MIGIFFKNGSGLVSHFFLKENVVDSEKPKVCSTLLSRKLLGSIVECVILTLREGIRRFLGVCTSSERACMLCQTRAIPCSDQAAHLIP